MTWRGQGLAFVRLAIGSLAGLMLAGTAWAVSPGLSLGVTGDILLARGIAKEIAKTGQSPWSRLKARLHRHDVVLGNFEGAVGPAAACQGSDPELCFAVQPAQLAWLRQAGFTAVSLENNHSRDLGEAHKAETAHQLAQNHIEALSEYGNPAFFRKNGVTLGVVALNRIPTARAAATPMTDWGLRHALALSQALADWTLAYPHWGTERISWANDHQEEEAAWLAAQGVQLIVGHHPHIVQPTVCRGAALTAYSLGNHVFDQKYGETKTGAWLECQLTPDKLTCAQQLTQAVPGSFYPHLKGPLTPLPDCAARPSPGLVSGGIRFKARPGRDGLQLEGWAKDQLKFVTPPVPLVKAVALALPSSAQEASAVLLLERHYSSLDRRVALRPYVYQVTPKGLVALWRGSGLAYPLIDLTVLPGERPGRICALHSGGAFLAPDVHPEAARTLAYEWTGFGFKAIKDDKAQQHCYAYYREDLVATQNLTDSNEPEVGSGVD